ncbi:hypothetical protein ANN_06197 [Periplaneta americana]|uniref:Uncharacterized protein n=1 Tax=Periplaneta americana TaxID=6978 RepID=A0ABQ8TFC5_PERAM|nr:hypothetical protein ANN_06197 [Periplaneta americana]
MAGLYYPDRFWNGFRKEEERGKTKENLDGRYKKWDEGERLGRTGLGGKRRMEEEDKNLNTLDTGRCSGGGAGGGADNVADVRLRSEFARFVSPITSMVDVEDVTAGGVSRPLPPLPAI